MLACGVCFTCCCGCGLVLFKVCLKVAFFLSIVSDILILKEVDSSKDETLKQLYILLVTSVTITCLSLFISICLYFYEKCKPCCCPSDIVVEDEQKEQPVALSYLEIVLTLIENTMEIAVLSFYINKLRTTQSLNFLRDEIETSTEQFVVIVKFTEALLGCLMIFLFIFLLVALRKYWKNSKEMINEFQGKEGIFKGMELSVKIPVTQIIGITMSGIMFLMGFVKLGLVIVFAKEIDFF